MNWDRRKLIRTIHVRQTYRKSRGVIICTFEKFKFEKNRYNFVDFIGVFDRFEKHLSILCLSLNDYIIFHLNFIKILLNLSFIFFLIFENFELQGMKFRILYGRQTNKIFSQVFLETVTVETIELFVSELKHKFMLFLMYYIIYNTSPI